MRHAVRPGKLLVACTVLLLVAAGCVKEESNVSGGQGNPTQGGGTVNIGLIAPFSGIASSVGRNMREGVQIAVDELNADGGVLGNQVEIVARDDEFRPENDPPAARELISQDNVAMIVGPAGATNYLSIKPLIDSNHTIDMPIVTDPILAQEIDPYAFRIMIPDSVQMNVLVDYAVKHYNNIAMIAEDQQTGHSQVKLAEAELAKKGEHFVDTELFDTDDLDYTPLVLKLKQSGADAVILGTHIGFYAARVLTAADSLGYHPQWLGLAGLTSYTYADLARDLVVGTVFVAPASPILAGGDVPPNAEHFYKEYVEKYFPDGTRSETGADKVIGAAFLTYDGVKMWAAAAEQAGSTDPEDVAKVFNSGFTFGPEESSADITWRYSATNHDGFQVSDTWFYQWVKDSHGIEFKFIGDSAKLAG